MSKKPLQDTNDNVGLVPLGPIPGQAPVASFNIEGVHNLLETKGFKGIHYRHAYSTDLNDLSAPADPNNPSSVRGLVYYRPKVLYHVPQSMRLEEALQIQGVFKNGSAIFNLSGRYEDGEEVNASIRDLIIFPTLNVLGRERIEYNPDCQKLKRRVNSVDYLIDSDNCEYIQGRDFVVTDKGLIKWTDSGKRPFDSTKGKNVLSCVYYYTPIYVIISMPHAVRVIPSNDIGHGALPRDAKYAPQLVVARESVAEQELAISDNKVPFIIDFEDLPSYSKPK